MKGGVGTKWEEDAAMGPDRLFSDILYLLWRGAVFVPINGEKEREKEK